MIDAIIALAACAGTGISVAAIISSEHAMAAAGEYSDGLEGLGLLLGIPALLFFVPALLCALAALRTGGETVRAVATGLVVAGFCGGPVLLFIAYSLLIGG